MSSSSNISYISLALVGSVIVGMIGGGYYYFKSTDDKLMPTGITSYNQVSKDSFYGGKRTKRKHIHRKKSRKL